MKALFIGGTGLISTAVSRLALERGIELYLLNRGSKRELESLGAHYLVADINDPEAAASALQGMEFDVAADFIAYSPADAERDYRLLRGRVGQYFFISSASAYRKPIPCHPITESMPLGNRFWDYSQKKADAEHWLFEKYLSEDYPVTVVRPSHTYGGSKLIVPLSGAKTQWTYADRMLRGAPMIVHGDGKSLWTVTHNTDFAKGFVGLMGNYSAVGQAFHLVSDEALTWDNIITTQCKILGVEPNIIHVASDRIVKSLPEYYGGLIGDKSESMVFDTSKIKRFVPSFICTTPFSLGIRQSIEALLAGEKVVDEDYNRRIDDFAAELDR